MKRQVVVLALFLFGGVCRLDAQESTQSSTVAGPSITSELLAISPPQWKNSLASSSELAAREFIPAVTPTVTATAFPDAFATGGKWIFAEAASEMALPRAGAPSPAQTRNRAGDDSRNRLEMALGYNFVRFRSSPITANMSGVNGSVAYYPWGRFGVEANATTGFGSTIFDGEHTKFLFYGGGLKYSEPRGRWEPWAHVLAGGVHMFPQTSLGGRNGFGVKAGGGVDFNWPRASIIWIRVEGNYIRSQLYSTSQNNFMISGGLVLRLIGE